ncbi:hypothetical protein KAW48_00380, partial [candidate division WOR-3 bacterium]|nr:hypothetical protein [candidate division WOR-3 bacterium]
KRMGKTDKDFEEWVIDHLYPMRGEDGKIIYLKDMAVRNIIVSSLGKKPSLNDLLMPIDSFVERYINTDEFKPSMNIYFSFPMEPKAAREFGEHLIMEGFAYRLVREKGQNRMDKEKMLDLFFNEYRLSYADNYGIYAGSDAQKKVLSNHGFLFFLFGNKVFSDLFMRGQLEAEISNSTEDTLRMVKNIFKKALIYVKRPEMTGMIINELQKIYSLLDETEEAIKLADSLLSIKDTPMLHLFKGEMLIMSARKAGDETKLQEQLLEAEKDFKSLLTRKETSLYAYKGLLDVYFLSNNTQKLEEIVNQIIDQPEVMQAMLGYFAKFDTAKAIFLLEQYKRRYPGERGVDGLIRRLKG